MKDNNSSTFDRFDAILYTKDGWPEGLYQPPAKYLSSLAEFSQARSTILTNASAVWMMRPAQWQFRLAHVLEFFWEDGKESIPLLIALLESPHIGVVDRASQTVQELLSGEFSLSASQKAELLAMASSQPSLTDTIKVILARNSYEDLRRLLFAIDYGKHQCTQAGCCGLPELHAYVDSGQSVNWHPEGSPSLLELAIGYLNIEFMRLLIKCGADVNDYMLWQALEVELDGILQANPTRKRSGKAMASVKLDGAFALLISAGANPSSIALELGQLCMQYDPSGAVVKRLQSILNGDEE